jgi:hypothetical protein
MPKYSKTDHVGFLRLANANVEPFFIVLRSDSFRPLRTSGVGGTIRSILKWILEKEYVRI